jgi:hypothetical protein
LATPGKQPVMVRRTEQHFYWMPETCEMFVAALCAIQDYYTWLDKRGIDPVVTVYCPNPQLQFLLPAFSKDRVVVVNTVESLDGLTLEGFDQAVKFDAELAYKLSAGTEKHVTQVFGMMVGSDPVKVCPDLSMITDVWATERDVQILPFPGSDKVAEFLLNNRPELDAIEAKNAENWQVALKGKLLVGVRSGLTYLAAAAGRSVVEIYPTDRHRNWLSKWSAGTYQMIYGNPGEVSPELVYRAVEAMWKKVEQRHRAMGMAVQA